jgi:DNA-binding transcriptional LysR family regulator
MNLKQMEAFKTLVRAGSVTGAAELLRLSQPTISKLVAQLESQSGIPLFERRKRRLIPTREAYALLAVVDRALTAIDNVDRTAGELAKNRSGELSVASIPTIGTGFLPRAVATFLSQRPGTKATLYVRTANHIVERVSGGLADVGLISDPVTDPSIVTTRFQDALAAICILPAGHPLRRKRFIQAADLRGEAFIAIGRDNNFRKRVDMALVDAGAAPQATIEATHNASAYALVASGAGISIVDPYTAISVFRHDHVIVRPFVPKVPFVVQLLTPANAPSTPVIQKFIAHLRNEHRRLIARLESFYARGV